MFEPRTPAELRHRITLQNFTTTTDDFNHHTKVWADVETVWAAIEPINSRELFAGGAEEFSTTHRVFIRYSTDVNGISNTWRVVFGTRKLNIKSILRTREDSQMYELLCEEGLRDGG